MAWQLKPKTVWPTAASKSKCAAPGATPSQRRARRPGNQAKQQPCFWVRGQGFGVVCAAPGATPLERCANGAGCTALGAPANEEGGVASGAARRF